MTRASLEDRLQLLSELDSIARDFDAIIQCYGPPADAEDVWQRIEEARAMVVQQLSAFASRGTIH